MEKKETNNKRLREIKGVVCLALALFLLLCLVSYHPQDPSLHHVVSQFDSTVQTTHNFTGKAGSYTADFLIWLLGIASFLLPVILFICSFQYFLRPEFTISTHRSVGFLFSVLSFSGIMAILISGSITLYGESLKDGIGGLIGVSIVGLLRIYFNAAGTYIILFLIFVVALTFMVEFSIVSVTERFSKRGAAFITLGKDRITSFVNFVFNSMKTENKPQPVVIEEKPVVAKKRPRKKSSKPILISLKPKPMTSSRFLPLPYWKRLRTRMSA